MEQPKEDFGIIQINRATPGESYLLSKTLERERVLRPNAIRQGWPVRLSRCHRRNHCSASSQGTSGHPSESKWNRI